VAVLVATTLGAFRVEPRANALLPYVQRFVVLAGALLAFSVVRRGAEVRRAFGLVGDTLLVSVGRHTSRLRLDDIERLDYSAPFAGTTSWMAATVLSDRDGRSWRIPTLVEDGDLLVRELIQRSGRNDLESWAEAYRVVSRMGRTARHIRLGYAVVVGLLVASVVYYLT
jgi:hypothetical protein